LTTPTNPCWITRIVLKDRVDHQEDQDDDEHERDDRSVHDSPYVKCVFEL